jgi:tRNA A37 threonylcarbamoyladenosine dehydratase
MENLEREISLRKSNDLGWSKPEEFDLRDKTDRTILARRFEAGSIDTVKDGLDLIAENLYGVEHPNELNNEASRRSYVDEVVNQSLNYCRWFYFPWTKELIRYPEIDNHRRLRTARNQNLITQAEQQRLYSATLAIFGLSVGSHVVENLVLSGIGGKLILADPDAIEPHNLNRLNADLADVGVLKVDHIAKKISKIDPYIEQVIIKEAVDMDSLSEITESHRPNIMFDEVDNLSAKALIRLEAKKSKIATVMATDLGDRSLIDIERHDLKDTKPFNGRIKKTEVDALATGETAEQLAKAALAKIIGMRNVTPRILDSFMEQGRSLTGIPQLGSTAAIGGALAAVAAREIILERKLDSGRYVFSFKETLGLRSPTPLLMGIKTFWDFVKFSKA